MEKTIEIQARTWRKPEQQATQWRRSLQRHVMGTLADRPVSDIGTADVIAVLKPMWGTIDETAGRDYMAP